MVLRPAVVLRPTAVRDLEPPTVLGEGRWRLGRLREHRRQRQPRVAHWAARAACAALEPLAVEEAAPLEEMVDVLLRHVVRARVGLVPRIEEGKEDVDLLLVLEALARPLAPEAALARRLGVCAKAHVAHLEVVPLHACARGVVCTLRLKLRGIVNLHVRRLREHCMLHLGLLQRGDLLGTRLVLSGVGVGEAAKCGEARAAEQHQVVHGR